MENNILVIRTNLSGTDAFMQSVFILLSKSPKSSFEFSISDSQIDLTTLTKNDLDNLDILLNCFEKDLGIEVTDLNKLINIRNEISNILTEHRT